MLEELNEASNLYNRVSDFENSHQVKLSEMLLNAYKNKTIQEDFSMLIL